MESRWPLREVGWYAYDADDAHASIRVVYRTGGTVKGPSRELGRVEVGESSAAVWIGLYEIMDPKAGNKLALVHR